MAVTFLTTEDAQAINTQLSNLCISIAELNRQLQMREDYTNRMKSLESQEEEFLTEKQRWEKAKASYEKSIKSKAKKKK